MSGVAAAGVGVSRPSKLITEKSHPITSISSHLFITRRRKQILGYQTRQHSLRTHCCLNLPISPTHHQILSSASSTLSTTPPSHRPLLKSLVVLIDLDPATAKLAIGLLGPFLSAFGFLFIVRIVMSWYPKLPVGKFPYVIAYAPTEPILFVTRKVIPPLGGVDVTPVVWFGLISFLNEILVGPQGLLVLLSQQQL
ncbi:hypothetical protein RD792_004854 [Penstemon davidsonii]|uniref:Protein COFACTOR ASSEMBLY OF COMPLEX C SUBUNIT B CCB3, chloroplastic n=1 Tax=Penstemon davidsonii TaxID=160366 RepID=A0ABR0DIK2_9LAMI|nr:hypothetical protein RD792_004854 [Penstemon davidsonii]